MKYLPKKINPRVVACPEENAEKIKTSSTVQRQSKIKKVTNFGLLHIVLSWRFHLVRQNFLMITTCSQARNQHFA